MRPFLLRMTVLAAVLACGALPFTAAADGLDAREREIVAWVDRHADSAVDLLEETVNISSGTMNHSGIRAVGAVMARELDATGLASEWIAMPPEVNRAGHLFARRDGDGPKVLLIGHLDTVFEADDSFQAFRREGNLAHGPGVIDMKSGNVIIVYALQALAAADALDDLSVVVAMTGDEEKTGRPLAVARRDLVEAGRWADYAFGFEAAVYDEGRDWATIARRSSSSWTLRVAGKQAHSSGIFGEETGAGAIFEAARILNAFYEEVRGEEYLTFNAGTIQGGTEVEYDPQQNRGRTFGKTNVVPRSVIVHGGLRTVSAEQLARAREAMERIVQQNLPHTSATIEFEDSYPAMPPVAGNRRLQALLSGVNEDLGRGPMRALDPARRGAADVSFVAPYADALAGLGAMGAGSHSPDERVELDSIPLAIKRAALLLYRLSKAHGRAD